MGLKIQYILHSTGTHHMYMYVITFCILFVQERNRRLNVEVELTLQMATEAVQDMEQVSQGNCQLSMFYSDSNKLATKSVLMAIDALIADLFDYGNM